MSPRLKLPASAVAPVAAPLKQSRKRKFTRFLKWLAVGLLGLELLYVVAVNLFLNFGLGLMFAGTNSINCTIGRALTFWPGTAYVRDVRVTFQDVNLQWTLDIAHATIDVDVTSLAKRTFHATSLKGEGAVFRMRHRVEPWSVNEPSVRVLTKIPEFPGPAVFEATVPEAPITEDKYNLWTVHLEAVDVGVTEAWVQQFRYVGGGRARGAFQLRPARTLWVGPASLDLDGGRFTAGSYLISPALAGRIDCVVHPFDVRKPEGLAVLRYISAGVRLRAPELSLAVSRLFLYEDGAPALSSASGDLLIDARTDHGVLKPDSRLELRQGELLVKNDDFAATVQRAELIARAKPSKHGEAALDLRGAKLTLAGSDATPVAVDEFVVAVESSSLDATQAWQLTGAELRKARIAVPDMRWFDTLAQKAGWRARGGSTTLSAQANYRDGVLAGELDAAFERVRLGSSELELELDGKTSFEASKASWQTLSGLLAGRLAGGRVKLTQGSSVFQAGGLELQGNVTAENGSVSARLSAQLASVGARAGTLRFETRGTLDARLENWDVKRGAGQSQLHGELRDLVLSVPDAQLQVRAKRAKLASNSRIANAWDVSSRAALDATLSTLRFTQGEPGAGLNGHADELVVSSRLARRPDGALDATLGANARGLEADYDRTRFRATPAINADVSAYDGARHRGHVRAQLDVRDFSANDLEGDVDCPWSSVDLASVRGLADLRGREGTHFDVDAVLHSARLAWGDFRGTLDKAHVATNFDASALDEQKGKVVVSVDLSAAKLVSGKSATTGWQAQLPKVDFDAQLQRQKGTLGGPMQLRAAGIESRVGKTPFRMDVTSNVSFAQLDLDKSHATGAGSVQVRGFDLALPDQKIDDWWADVSLDYVDLSAKENLDGTATFSAKMRDALPALSVLAAQDELPGWVPSIFPLRGLAAEGMVRRRCRLTEFRLSDLSGGPFVAVGRMQSVPDSVRGAFLVRLAAAHPISAGVRFDGDDSGVKMFAGSGWLQERYEPLDRFVKATEDDACIPEPRECGN